MIPWIQVYSNLMHHPKTTRLADELGIKSADVNPNTVAVGILVGVWTWAIQNAYNGDLSKCSDRAIAEAAGWKRRPDALVSALLKTEWIDGDRKLHDWENYAVLLIDAEDAKRAKTNERVKRYRDKKAREESVSRNAIVTLV